MKQKAVFFHAGCNVCIGAERRFPSALDPQNYEAHSVLAFGCNPFPDHRISQ